MLLQKMGRIVTPEILSRLNWGDKTHTQIPTPYIKEDGSIRMFFSVRRHGKSLPLYADLACDTFQILNICEKPLLEHGGRGTFDEFGIMPTDVINMGDEVWMYYVGWQLGINVSYTLAVGLAVSRDHGTTFKKAFEGPILDRTKDEPYMTMSPFIIKENGLYYMFYASGKGFIHENNKYEPQYQIMYATSLDGVEWKRNNKDVLNPLCDDESNTRPTIIKINDKYHMWFCYRGAHDFRNGINSYRIGYASSVNLIEWDRNDGLAGISNTERDFDDKMITYPYVKKINDVVYLFYNGNGFGQSGIGCAKLMI